MVRSSKEAMAAALKQTSNEPGTCQLTVRNWFGAPSAGDRDRDGDADAVDGWLSEPARFRHPGDRNPPPGKPLAFSGGSRGFGHRALSLPNGVRSTDMWNNRYKSGITSTVTGGVANAIATIERSMGVKYLGWSETITGLMIPNDPEPPKEIPVSKLLFEMRVATCNLMQYPKNRNIPKTLESVNGCKVIGFQEVNRPAFKKRLKRRWPNIIGLGHLDKTDYGSPLVVNKNVFNYIKTGTTPMYPTAAGISRTRHLTWAIAEHKSTKQRVGIINLHAVDVKNDQHLPRRLKLREKCKAALDFQIAQFQQMGLPILITGDFNDTANWVGPKVGGQRVQRIRHRVDQILVIDSDKAKWTIVRHSVVDTPSNHHTLRAKLSLSRR